ncbi:IclR family transcriptional regulator [Natronolimnobius baerhuensis]|uniref:IclR family transcriptional regulator n=1 Tax=Natronolimnobius baerhuensis TaxID=253108 RepID=A0A202E475_9EURY|nr:IclR family transcriptional regulator [Natronolimnobius baerhuensis]OVE83106.1 IclR family transcriptional regulator [Natronolimnobius baerhuensis]
MAKSESSVRSVSRTFAILEVIQELDGASVSEIADRVDIGQSAVYNYLTTLSREEYVDKVGDEYHLGLSFFGLGAHARNRTPIYDTAQPQVDELAEKTGHLVTLCIETDGVGTYLYQSRGENGIDIDVHEGEPVPLHSTALGKAILAFRPREDVDAILDQHGLPASTAHTITDREELYTELEEIRDRQYAISQEEWRNGLRSLAVPISDAHGRSIAAVGIACPVYWNDDTTDFDDDLLQAVLGTANVIELEHNYA